MSEPSINSDTVRNILGGEVATRVLLRAFDGDSPQRGYPGTRNAWDVMAAAFGPYPAYLYLTEYHPNGVDGARALLLMAGVPIPAVEPIVVEVPVRISVDLDDYRAAYGLDGDFATMLDVREHIPNLIREEIAQVLARIGYGSLLPY